MIHPHPFRVLLAFFAIFTAGAVSAQSAPPSSPPADWGPVSINLEEIEYPYPVSYMDFRVYNQDVRLAYMDVAPSGPANGRTVIFHHGGLYYGWYWEKQIAALSEAGYRVIAKDRLGWGKSSKPVIPYSINLWASNTARLMDHLGIEQAAVVGHSIGGQMVTRFAFLYPERATHVVTINQVGLTDGRKGRGFQPLTGEVDINPDMDEVYAGLLRWADGNYVNWHPEFAEHMRIRYGNRLSGDWPRMAYVSRLTGQMRGMDTVVNDWQHIETKTLILGGAEDYPTYAEEARNAAEIFPNGEVVNITGIGHNPHEEAPDIVNAELIRFLGS
ncbi:MAG: alpha/beta hydrolase [Gammaproteobacteria bacterium]|nr:alpha/beta hydrolase [Gammaproteobacteria bacterium]